MNVQCPECGEAIRLQNGRCARCAFALTVPGIWRHFVRSVRRKTQISCPSCREPAEIAARECRACGALLTLENVIGATVEPTRKKVERRMANATPGFKRGVQWAVFALSLVTLWLLLTFVQARKGSSVLELALLSSVYLAFFGLLSVFFLPRKLIWTIRHRASAISKLSLIANFFSALLLLQLALGTWQKQAGGLAILFGTVWLGAVILTRFFWPLLCDVMSLFSQANVYFNSADPQGRSARFQ